MTHPTKAENLYLYNMKTINEKQANDKILEIGEAHGLSNDQIKKKIKLVWDELKVLHGKDNVSDALWDDLQKAFQQAEYPDFRFEI